MRAHFYISMIVTSRKRVNATLSKSRDRSTRPSIGGPPSKICAPEHAGLRRARAVRWDRREWGIAMRLRGRDQILSVFVGVPVNTRIAAFQCRRFNPHEVEGCGSALHRS